MFKNFKERVKDSRPALVQLELWIAIDMCLKTTKHHHSEDGINLQRYATLRKQYTETVDNLCLVRVYMYMLCVCMFGRLSSFYTVLTNSLSYRNLGFCLEKTKIFIFLIHFLILHEIIFNEKNLIQIILVYFLLSLFQPSFPLTMNAAVCFLWCKETQEQILVRLAMYWWRKMDQDYSVQLLPDANERCTVYSFCVCHIALHWNLVAFVCYNLYMYIVKSWLSLRNYGLIVQLETLFMSIYSSVLTVYVLHELTINSLYIIVWLRTALNYYCMNFGSSWMKC